VVNVAGGFFLYDLISWIIYGYVIAKYVEEGGRQGGREGGREGREGGRLSSTALLLTVPVSSARVPTSQTIITYPTLLFLPPSLPPSLPPFPPQIRLDAALPPRLLPRRFLGLLDHSLTPPSLPSLLRYDWMQLFHHGSCLIGSWACWSSGRSGADVTFALFVAELANPFMYLRYLLRELGWKDTKLARTNQVRREGGREGGRGKEITRSADGWRRSHMHRAPSARAFHLSYSHTYPNPPPSPPLPPSF